jgi:hypothetical protein
MSDSFDDLKPSFIGGHRKSGTTLLLTLFDGHPQICTFPVDSGFFYAFFPKYLKESFSKEERMDRICDFTFRQNFKIQLEKDSVNRNEAPDIDELEETFRNKSFENESYREYLRNMIAAYRDNMDSRTRDHRRWLEKTTSSELYASEVFDWFENPKFMHLIRDPRDNFASLKSGWDEKYSDRGHHPWELLQSMLDRALPGLKIAKPNRSKFGENYYRIFRYENLVSKPDQVINKMCDFLNVKFDDSLYTPTVFGQTWEGNNFEGKTFDGISNENVGRWPDRISTKEAKILEFYFADVMDELNYEREFSLKDCRKAVRDFYEWRNYNSGIDV